MVGNPRSLGLLVFASSIIPLAVSAHPPVSRLRAQGGARPLPDISPTGLPRATTWRAGWMGTAVPGGLDGGTTSVSSGSVSQGPRERK
jgi:hypothetical protein